MNNCTHRSTSRVICLALLLSVFIVVTPGKTMAGPWDRGALNMEDEALKDMRWREKVERPRTRTPQQAMPAPVQGPAVPQPDLSGLPRILPQNAPDTLPPVQATQAPGLTKPRLSDSGLDQHTLINPHLKGAAAHETTPVAREKAPEPVQRAMQVPPRSPEFARTPVHAVDAHRQGALPRPKLDNSRHEKQGLIKPRLGKVPARERTHAARQRVPSPAREAVRGMPAMAAPQPRVSPSKDKRSALAPRSPAPAMRQAAAQTMPTVGPPAQPKGPGHAKSGLIKPHLRGGSPTSVPRWRTSLPRSPQESPRQWRSLRLRREAPAVMSRPAASERECDCTGNKSNWSVQRGRGIS